MPLKMLCGRFSSNNLICDMPVFIIEHIFRHLKLEIVLVISAAYVEKRQPMG